MKKLKAVAFPLLWLLSLLYGAGALLKKSLYEKGVLPSKKLPAKVICVGNLTLGGTGKTTTIIHIAEYAMSKGLKTVILTRGYGRRTRGTQIVSDGSRVLMSVGDAGDEAYLTAGMLEGVPVVACEDRFAGGTAAVERFRPDVILLDDGFQHWKLRRDANIVLVDCLDPFGGGRLFPLGFLREPLEGIRRAHVVMFTHSDLISGSELGSIREKVARLHPGAALVDSRHMPVLLKNFVTNEKTGVDWLSGRKAAAFSGIGNPNAFELTLKSLGAEILYNYRFMDHHWFGAQELGRLLATAETLVTTPKDAVRLRLVKGLPQELLSKIYVLEIRLGLPGGDNKWLENLLA